MKTDGNMTGAKVSRLIGRLFGRKRHGCTQVYLKRFESIEKLVRNGLLAVDYGENLAVLDTSVHLLYMNDDRAYAAFFDTLRAYINFHRGMAGMEEMTCSEDRINFMVTIRRSQLVDDETGEYFFPPKETMEILLVGYFQNGKVDYSPYEKK